MPPTIRQVAQKANVSPATVSRVLNDYPYVNPETRSIVQQAVHDLGYATKRSVRVERQAKSILLLARSGQTKQETENLASHSIERVLYAGAQPVLEKNGFTIRFQTTRMDVSEARLYSQNPEVGGLIFSGGVVNRELLALLLRARVPMVVAGAHVSPMPINCVTAAYLEGMAALTEHMLANGRRKIALINGPGTTSSSEEKEKGFRLALARYGLTCDSARILHTDFDAASGYAATKHLLSDAPDVDAIAYASDSMAVGGIHALNEAGRRIPDDVAVTGFYDYDFARFTDPPLTTTWVDFQAIGAIAARRLLMLLNEPDKQAWTISLPCSMTVRRSSGQTSSPTIPDSVC